MALEPCLSAAAATASTAEGKWSCVAWPVVDRAAGLATGKEVVWQAPARDAVLAPDKEIWFLTGAPSIPLWSCQRRGKKSNEKVRSKNGKNLVGRYKHTLEITL